MRPHSRTVRIAALSLCAALLTACESDTNNESGMSTQEQFDSLMRRPDLEQAQARYEDLQKQIRAALKKKFDLSQWEEDPETVIRSSYCREFPDVDGLDVGNINMPIWAAKGGIPQKDWPTAQAVLRDLGGQLGFGRVTLDADQGGNRMYEIVDGYGAKLTLGTMGNTTLSVGTGCHLKPKAKKRGRPITREEADQERWGDN